MEVNPLNVFYIHYNYYVIPVYRTKDDVTSRVYNDLSGFGALKQTLQDARKVDASIKLDDVRQWMEENAKRKQQLKGRNSFVANGPYHQYQPDLMFIKHLEDQQYDTAMVCIDTFTKIRNRRTSQRQERERPCVRFN